MSSEQQWLAFNKREEDADVENFNEIHVVLLGDSTLDNARYLDIAQGELSIEKQLLKRCSDHGWGFTLLAQDGSLLQDVMTRQIPYIPEKATHIVMSASGNDLLSLLNMMVAQNFSAASMYNAIVHGLQQVADRYNSVIKSLKSVGCHIACCTVYQPKFNNLFFKSLAAFSLGLYNSRLKQIATTWNCSIIDFANLFDHRKDFANALELGTTGGAKLVENISQFVREHPPVRVTRLGQQPVDIVDDFIVPAAGPDFFGLKCCSTRLVGNRIYCVQEADESLETTDLADLALMARTPLVEREPRPFSEAQRRWREGV